LKNIDTIMNIEWKKVFFLKETAILSYYPVAKVESRIRWGFEHEAHRSLIELAWFAKNITKS